VKTKICFKCGKRKRRTSFYRHPQMADGLLGKCKVCTKRDVAARYEGKRDVVRAYERKRFQRAGRKADEKRYLAARRRAHPGKYRALTAVGNAVRDGRLLRQPCEKCGDPKVQAHHDDYRRPLAVRWLCFRCHRGHHGQRVG
jgi:ribosomal protein S27AE